MIKESPCIGTILQSLLVIAVGTTKWGGYVELVIMQKNYLLLHYIPSDCLCILYTPYYNPLFILIGSVPIG